MSMLLAALMFIPILAVTIGGLLWSVGRTWPFRDAVLLAHTVIGRPGVDQVPRIPTFVFAVVMLSAGIVALALADKTGGGAALTAVGVVFGLIFLARGVAGYSRWWAERMPVEPFFTANRKTYSPLALILGVGFLVLVIMRLV
jgi:hypothetical protein